MTTYEVHIIPKHPAYGDRGNILTISAATKAKAISAARKEVWRECLYHRLDGALIYTAKAAA